MEHFNGCPSGPIGFVLRPNLPFPDELDRDLPLPLKYVTIGSEERNTAAFVPCLPWPPLRLATLRLFRLRFFVKRLHFCLYRAWS